MTIFGHILKNAPLQMSVDVDAIFDLMYDWNFLR